MLNTYYDTLIMGQSEWSYESVITKKKSIGSKKEKEPEKPQEFLNFGSYVAQGDDDNDQPNTKSDMLF